MKKSKLGLNIMHPRTEALWNDVLGLRLRSVLILEEMKDKMRQAIESCDYPILRFMLRLGKLGSPPIYDPDHYWGHAAAAAPNLPDLAAYADELGKALLVQFINEEAPTFEQGRLEAELARRLDDIGARLAAGNWSRGSYNEEQMRAWYEGWGIDYLAILPHGAVWASHEGAHPIFEYLGPYQEANRNEWPEELPDVVLLGEEAHLVGRYQHYKHPDQDTIITELAIGRGWRFHGVGVDETARQLIWADRFYMQDPSVLAANIFCSERHHGGAFHKDAVYPEVWPSLREHVIISGETTNGPECSDDMEYVADVTIPDGTQMKGGQPFVKTWKVRNSGTCDWGDGYGLVFVAEDQMGGPSSIPVTAESGDTVEVSLNLTAPGTRGTHSSRWQMRAPSGKRFGGVVFVHIEVGDNREQAIEEIRRHLTAISDLLDKMEGSSDE